MSKMRFFIFFLVMFSVQGGDEGKGGQREMGRQTVEPRCLWFRCSGCCFEHLQLSGSWLVPSFKFFSAHFSWLNSPGFCVYSETWLSCVTPPSCRPLKVLFSALGGNCVISVLSKT